MADGGYDIVVIGGGAAGLFAAGQAAERGLRVAVAERNKLATKVKITGKGRCNLTNNCTPAEFLENVVSNPRFLYGAINRFSPSDTMEFFESLGVSLKTERGARVFPESDSAIEVANALAEYAKARCEIVYDAAGALAISGGAVSGVKLKSGKTLGCTRALIATGGMSYPRTGSDGAGYRLAKQAGHRIIEPKAALCPIVCSDRDCLQLEGLSLKNIVLKCKTKNGSNLFCEQGELVFTANGVSGPLALTLSSRINRLDIGGLSLEIDLKPALDELMLDRRVLRDFSSSLNKELKNALFELLPKSIVPSVISRSGIAPGQKVNGITAVQRAALVNALKHFSLSPSSLAPIDQAIVTAGGVDVREIDPKTMESKLVRGLYFAGEVIDVDALTGGYNLQTAFSTAYCAAEAMGDCL